MSETVSMDDKGRLVLPKRIREAAGITPGAVLVARASGAGSVELSDPEVFKARAREIGARKLSGWNEESHEATAYLTESARGKNEAR
ncbi:MAG: division/cell wall cluster transcriptional repressor MraZ [Nitrososphaerota archaeon]|nr:division/cell wall cluster transcriptional repressor MraZ [Nitrososphaerota archaeon]MDG7012973.1 division/cell wall cluster transcriptional repressor MraZ [Nitrososphaerota archaeon]MDG7026753.1 division/cell wall cluster transcriptional repressor MraZ [Nitrososphaerota archaeon]